MPAPRRPALSPQPRPSPILAARRRHGIQAKTLTPE